MTPHCSRVTIHGVPATMSDNDVFDYISQFFPIISAGVLRDTETGDGCWNYVSLLISIGSCIVTVETEKCGEFSSFVNNELHFPRVALSWPFYTRWVERHLPWRIEASLLSQSIRRLCRVILGSVIMSFKVILPFTLIPCIMFFCIVFFTSSYLQMVHFSLPFLPTIPWSWGNHLKAQVLSLRVVALLHHATFLFARIQISLRFRNPLAISSLAPPSPLVLPSSRLQLFHSFTVISLLVICTITRILVWNLRVPIVKGLLELIYLCIIYHRVWWMRIWRQSSLHLALSLVRKSILIRSVVSPKDLGLWVLHRVKLLKQLLWVWVDSRSERNGWKCNTKRKKVACRDGREQSYVVLLVGE